MKGVTMRQRNVWFVILIVVSLSWLVAGAAVWNPLGIPFGKKTQEEIPELKAFTVSVNTVWMSTGQIAQLVSVLNRRPYTHVVYDISDPDPILDLGIGVVTFYVTAPVDTQLDIEDILYQLDMSDELTGLLDAALWAIS
jgi:hypothetical protein